jgi:hypothetical protein
MNTSEVKVTITLTGAEVEEFLTMRRNLADADRINGELVNEIEGLKRNNAALSNRVDFLEKRVVKVNRALKAAQSEEAETAQ